jgi:hypothetical protein
LAIQLAVEKRGMEKDIVEWIFELFDEIEEPTLRDRAQLFSLLVAEVESWSNDSSKGIEND